MTKERLREIANEVHALATLKQQTGFQCRRVVVELLKPLSNAELIEVSKMVAAMAAATGAKNDVTEKATTTR